ncbi:YajG family lipoprotein [Halomonas vilamensis]|uniref:YajG family lipoprotein n=1 Tax=Vreelandella vilamensis TaxID=531309 RepID=A0ABU1H2U1_9GAMM|nr:YajG family lipoprotein [Halomonas vilamensis]MDR5898613.1 YajG family lipoprotein [Halomonas vilamensis]
MLRRRFLTLSGALLASVWLAGCASPHYLSLSPTRSADVPQTGQGQRVTVMAQDGRATDVIGQRSGSGMSTATITVSSHELIPHLQKEAERAVRDMGFTPTMEKADGRPSLILELASLTYVHGDSSQPALDEAQLEGVFRAIGRHQGTTYTGTYTSRRTQSFAVKPGEAANTRMLNDLLSDGLDRAFSDPELAELLAR